MEGGAEAVGKTPVLGWIASPHGARVALDALEATADEDCRRLGGRGPGRCRVVEHGIAVVHREPALAVREDRVGGRVLAEVLHPAVVAGVDRFGEELLA